jgi:hypothetical protein
MSKPTATTKTATTKTATTKTATTKTATAKAATKATPTTTAGKAAPDGAVTTGMPRVDKALASARAQCHVA